MAARRRSVTRSIASVAPAVSVAVTFACAALDSATLPGFAASTQPTASVAVTERAKSWFGRLQRRDVDRTQLTAAMNAGLTSGMLASVAAQIAPLGAPVTFPVVRTLAAHGDAVYVYRPTFAKGGALEFTFALDPAAKIDGLFLAPVVAAATASVDAGTPASGPAPTPQIDARAREWFGRLQRRDVDATQLTPQMRVALVPAAVEAGAKLIAPLGEPATFPFVRSSVAGGVAEYVYRPTFASGEALEFTFALDAANAVAGVFVTPTTAAGSTPVIDRRANDWLRRMRAGDVDRTQLSADLDAALTPAAIASVRKDLADRGEPASVTFARAAKLANVTAYVYEIAYAAKPSLLYTFTLDDAGKVAGLFFRAK